MRKQHRCVLRSWRHVCQFLLASVLQQCELLDPALSRSALAGTGSNAMHLCGQSDSARLRCCGMAFGSPTLIRHCLCFKLLSRSLVSATFAQDMVPELVSEIGRHAYAGIVSIGPVGVGKSSNLNTVASYMTSKCALTMTTQHLRPRICRHCCTLLCRFRCCFHNF